MSTPLHKSPPSIHCRDNPRLLRRAGTRVMQQGQGGRRDTAHHHHLRLVLSAGGHRRGHLAQGPPTTTTPGSTGVGMYPQCKASLGRIPLGPGVTTSPRPPHPLPPELSAHCSWGHRARTHITHVHPVYMPGHIHEHHTHSPCPTWWVGPTCVGGCGHRKD